MTSSRQQEVTLIFASENFRVSAFPNVPKDTDEDRASNSAVIFLERVDYPKLINTKCLREGGKIKANECPEISATGAADEEVETIFFGGTERALSIVVHVTV